MKGWITLNILCDTEESIKLGKMDLKVTQEDCVFKEHLIQISQIGTIGKNEEIKGSFLIVSGRSMEVKENPIQILILIEEDSKLK